jgi:5-methylthioribose kinase
MMLEAPSYTTIGAVTYAARELRHWQPDFAR